MSVRTITPTGAIELVDGLVIPSACIFLNGRVFLWDVSSENSSLSWNDKERYKIFEVVVPKPEILLLGTGRSAIMPSPSLRAYLNHIGIQIDIMDTRNACSTYNLLAEEGRRVAAALLPVSPSPVPWHSPSAASSL